MDEIDKTFSHGTTMWSNRENGLALCGSPTRVMLEVLYRGDEDMRLFKIGSVPIWRLSSLIYLFRMSAEIGMDEFGGGNSI